MLQEDTTQHWVSTKILLNILGCSATVLYWILWALWTKTSLKYSDFHTKLNSQSIIIGRHFNWTTGAEFFSNEQSFTF